MFAEAEVPPAVHPRNVQSTTFAPTNGRFQHRTAALIDPEQLKQAGLAFGCAASLDLVIGIPAEVITSSGIGHQIWSRSLGGWRWGLPHPVSAPLFQNHNIQAALTVPRSCLGLVCSIDHYTWRQPSLTPVGLQGSGCDDQDQLALSDDERSPPQGGPFSLRQSTPCRQLQPTNWIAQILDKQEAKA